MTLNSSAITFRLENLLKNPYNYKNNEKELLSTIKVLEELEKERKRSVISRKSSNIAEVLENIKQKIAQSTTRSLQENLRKNGKS